MTLDEAIKHAEEVAKEQDKLCKRYDDASGYTRSHNEEIRTSAAKRCEECAEEHRQLAEWLKDLKQLREQLKESETLAEVISREAVIERLKKEDKILYTTTGLNYLIRVIEELPSITQKSETVTEFADRCRECGAKYGKILKQAQSGDLISREETLTAFADYVGSGMSMDDYDALWNIVTKMPSVKLQEPKTEQYEKHTDHTDCIWYGRDSGCPVTCSQYRDGWNDAMDYIFKNGKGYQPYRHDS